VVSYRGIFFGQETAVFSLGCKIEGCSIVPSLQSLPLLPSLPPPLPNPSPPSLRTWVLGGELPAIHDVGVLLV